MPETILSLWRGDIAPCDHCGSHDGEANHLLGLMEHNREKLQAGLTAAQGEIFQKYMDCAEEYQFRMLELAFRDGFSLGSRLTAESLME